jgi:hypothetical protein
MWRITRWFLAGVTMLAALGAAALVWMRWMPGRSFRGSLPPPTAEERAVEMRLRESIGSLAGPLAPRSLAQPDRLEAAASFIEKSLAEHGYEVSPQPFDARGKPVRNIQADLRGGPELVVVGAHYDSFEHVPGANDNASGVAAILEMARLLQGKRFARTVRWTLFVNEEPPYFQTRSMGSRVQARRAREHDDRIALMINIDMIGCYRDDEVDYGFPFSALIGKRGDFIAFLGNPSSAARLRQTVGLFRSAGQFPSEGMILPERYSDVTASDHASYWSEGYEAVYVTDTGPVRGCPWHSAADVPDAMDFARMSRVVVGLVSSVAGIADEPAP